MRISRNCLVFADINKSLVNPVADTLQRISFLVVFEDLELEDFKDALRKVSEIVVDMLISHFFEVEPALTH